MLQAPILANFEHLLCLKHPQSHLRSHRSHRFDKGFQCRSGPLVKICGITSPSDAELVAEAGAAYVGMIVWPKAKRSVSLATARDIVNVVRKYGAEPVGVFVDEDASAIEEACAATGLRTVQLHGDGARTSLPSLSKALDVIYVLHAGADGALVTRTPSQQAAQNDPALIRFFHCSNSGAYPYHTP